MTCTAMRIEKIPSDRAIRAFYQAITQNGPVSELMYRNDFQRRRLRRIKEILSLILPWARRVLDFGCCEGLIAQWVAPKVDMLVGCDLAAPAIERAKALNLPNAEFLCGSLAAVQKAYPEEKFDLVIASEILEHVRYPDQTIARLRDMARGVLATVPIHEKPNPEAFSVEAAKRPKGVRKAGDGTGHIWCFRPDTFKALFEEVWHYEDDGISAILVGR